MASRASRRSGTKTHACPTCGVANKGQVVWCYHGRTGRRELVLHRMRAHKYVPRSDERQLTRRFV